jgi:nitrite reductase/ring-hydroxylating ferredoxin subunit
MGEGSRLPLTAQTGYKLFTKRTLAGEYIGFGGVIVYHALDDNFYAFDLACPVEANRSIRVEMNEDNIHATCPKCGSVFDLSYGFANPENKGSAKEGLRPYKVNMQGDILYVTN